MLDAGEVLEGGKTDDELSSQGTETEECVLTGTTLLGCVF